MLSRVAESLYWMSRYLERAEHTARLVDVNLVLMLDQAQSGADGRWERLFASLTIPLPEGGADDARTVMESLTFDRSSRTSIAGALEAARDNARQVRQQISTELWEQLNRLYLGVSRASIETVWNAEPHTFLRAVQDGTHLVQGVADATMPRGEGWHFMQLGRFVERANATAALIDAHRELLDTGENPPGVNEYLDWLGLLKARSAFEAYCQAYTADLRPDRIAEFLLLDAEFPRSARFSAAEVRSALRAIAQATGSRKSEQVERPAGRLQALLAYAHIDEIVAGGAHSFAKDIQSLCAQIHRAIHEAYFAPPLETVLAS